MSRVLVIGGNLFIGREMVERLLARGDDVTIMHRKGGTPWGGRVRELHADRNDVAATAAALAGHAFEEVYDNVYDFERGTTADQVVAAARAVAGPHLRRYVFMSSVAAYGEGLDHDETDALAPADHPSLYTAQKAESERALFRASREEGIPVSTVRPAFIYGAHNPYEREWWFWDRIMAGRPVIVPGDGSTPMQFVDARDVARVALLAAGRPASDGAAYSLGCYPPISQVGFIELLARVAGKPGRIVPVPRERIEAAGGSLFAPPLYFGVYLDLPPVTATGARTRDDLGFEEMPLDRGFADAFAWYRTQERPRPDFSWEDRVIG